MDEEKQVRGVWVSTMATYKKLAEAQAQSKQKPLFEELTGKPDYVCLVGSGPSNGKPKVWKVSIEDDIPNKEKVIEALEAAFNENATRTKLSDLWNEYNLWGHTVFYKLVTISEKKRQETRALLGTYTPLQPSLVGCRIIEAMMNAKPGYSPMVDDMPAKPLNAIDKLMIYAIAVQYGNLMTEIEEKQGVEAAKRCKEIIKMDSGNFLQVSVVIDMKWLTDRCVDAFKQSGRWRPNQDVKELEERLAESIKNLCRTFRLRFKDDNSKMRDIPSAFLAPTPGRGGKYQVSSLFAYLEKDYYEEVDFTALCDGYKELGEVFLNLKTVLGANRARLSRANSKPITIDGLSLFSEEELKAMEEGVSEAAKKMKRQRAKSKLKKAIEKAGDKAPINVGRNGKVTIYPAPKEDEKEDENKDEKEAKK